MAHFCHAHQLLTFPPFTCPVYLVCKLFGAGLAAYLYFYTAPTQSGLRAGCYLQVLLERDDGHGVWLRLIYRCRIKGYSLVTVWTYVQITLE